ncbi:hypothetical protein OG947_10935 [Rhodococcus sp. NBC_00297]|nr:hypothetical protein [Rhodococcus sp. NBC_00297]
MQFVIAETPVRVHESNCARVCIIGDGETPDKDKTGLLCHSCRGGVRFTQVRNNRQIGPNARRRYHRCAGHLRCVPQAPNRRQESVSQIPERMLPNRTTPEPDNDALSVPSYNPGAQFVSIPLIDPTSKDGACISRRRMPQTRILHPFARVTTQREKLALVSHFGHRQRNLSSAEKHNCMLTNREPRRTGLVIRTAEDALDAVVEPSWEPATRAELAAPPTGVAATGQYMNNIDDVAEILERSRTWARNLNDGVRL